MKSFEIKIDPLTGEDYYEVNVRGANLLNEPLLNKGSCFSREERAALDLLGLLPWGVSSIEGQVARAKENFERKTDDLEKYIFLAELQNRNETLYYRLLLENLEEMVPIVYTPVVGQACLQMSHIFRRARGLYVHRDNVGNIDDYFRSVKMPDVRLIVVTDGERILGLGDLGSDGMGIPIGKVALYVAAGGLHPACCLPICLDVGTNNKARLEDPLYMGIRKPRLEGAEYDAFIEAFVLAVRRNFPHALLQWEDFAKHKAFRLLERYRERLPSFDDDIQGTGAVSCAALMTAMRIKKTAFRDQRFTVFGMGQAGTGISRAIAAALREEGLSEVEVRSRFAVVDQQGLLVEGDPTLEGPQLPFATARDRVAEWRLESPDRIGLMDVLKNHKPTVLIGVTARKGAFDEAVLTQMARNDPRPIILALSNPTAKAECTAQEVARFTDGRFLMATGSPFAPVETAGGLQHIAQCNNMYIFPGVGLGALIARSPHVTDSMFVAASKALSGLVTPDQERCGLLLPRIQDVREVSVQVALAVAKEARDKGLGRLLDDQTLEALVRRSQWQPTYRRYRPSPCPVAARSVDM